MEETLANPVKHVCTQLLPATCRLTIDVDDLAVEGERLVVLGGKLPSMHTSSARVASLTLLAGKDHSFTFLGYDCGCKIRCACVLSFARSVRSHTPFPFQRAKRALVRARPGTVSPVLGCPTPAGRSVAFWLACISCVVRFCVFTHSPTRTQEFCNKFAKKGCERVACEFQAFVRVAEDVEQKYNIKFPAGKMRVNNAGFYVGDGGGQSDDDERPINDRPKNDLQLLRARYNASAFVRVVHFHYPVT